jgi:hypothetical protein
MKKGNKYCPYIYWVEQKSANLKHSLVLSGMFTFKPSGQFAERYHSAASYALNMEGLISNIFYKLSNEICNIFYF